MPAEHEDSTELVELSFNSSPGSSNNESEIEDLEPVLKRGHTCSNETFEVLVIGLT